MKEGVRLLTEYLTNIENYIIPFALVGLSVLLVGILLGVLLGRWVGRLESSKAFQLQIKEERSDAVKRSRAVLTGQINEQLAPYLPDFPGNPAEARFIGKPIDFILFSGLSQGAVDKVVFVEVKSLGSQLSSVERSLRDAILEGRVEWREYRIP